jgi:glycosyltransferase involved in cell wall biosynthesis
MRVLKVVQSYFPFQDRGGPVVKVRALAQGLCRRGHRVTVLTADLGFPLPNGNGTGAKKTRWGWEEQESGVAAIYLHTAWHYRALTVNPRVMRFCGANLKDFDLVHVYGLYDLLGPAVGRYCRKERIPYVVEPMGMYRPIIRSVRLKQIYHHMLGRPFLDGARRLVATSEQEKQEITGGGVLPERVVIRRNGIEIPEKIPERGEFRREHSINPETKIVLFLGRIVPKKSPDLLLQSFARWRRQGAGSKQALLVLAGPEEGDGYLDRLRMMAKELRVDEQVLFPGPLYDDAKWSAYRDADVFVLPSQNENFGNTAAEAAACGTPVIVTDRCGIASYLGTAGLVIHHNDAEVQHALQKILTDSGFQEHCQEGCKELARKLSWEEPLEQMEGIYAQCVSEGHRG